MTKKNSNFKVLVLKTLIFNYLRIHIKIFFQLHLFQIWKFIKENNQKIGHFKGFEIKIKIEIFSFINFLKTDIVSNE